MSSSSAAFEFTVKKMARKVTRLYFWTFTFREVHSVKKATAYWNEFLTLLKRNLSFRGVRVIELHEDHGVHFHVITDKRYKIRKMLDMGERYGFGRTHVAQVTDVAGNIVYLCKYLSKPRPPCLKRARLWAAFGEIERTRVKDIVSDSPLLREIRRIMGRPTPDELLDGERGMEAAKNRRPIEKNFLKAKAIAMHDYIATFDSAYAKRQLEWQTKRFQNKVKLSFPWFGEMPVAAPTF